jgi:hypothetical protein
MKDTHNYTKNVSFTINDTQYYGTEHNKKKLKDH